MGSEMCIRDRGKNVGGEIELIVEDKDGRVVEHVRKPMDSFVKNVNFLLNIYDKNAWIVTDMSGAEAHVDPMTASVLAPAGEDNYGILVGTGSTPFDVTQYSLTSKISHGAGSGQLSYGEQSTVMGTETYEQWQRSFDNNSGADITVYEIGMACKTTKLADGTSETHYILLARDVITPVTVPNGGRLTVKYKFQINP